MKMGEEGEDRGEDIGEDSEEKVEMVDGETGESCSEPERDEEEPETDTDKESTAEMREMSQRVKKTNGNVRHNYAKSSINRKENEKLKR